EFLGQVSHDWANQVAEYLRADGVPAAEAALLARELVALWRGLQFDLLSAVDADALAASHAAAADAFAERCARADPVRAHPRP
ncbi:MAG TPA: hypothetical protein VNP03_21035, partial [Pseudonocardia sp.]|nr:hypothetical protein [Pseudonocardia sp.]